MRHTLPVVFLIGLTACGPKALPLDAAPSASYKAAYLEGNWIDNGGTHYTFDSKGNATTVVDHDGEFFPVTSTAKAANGNVSWTYNVPSTGYVVTHVVETVGGSMFTATWSNGDNAGSETFHRE